MEDFNYCVIELGPQAGSLSGQQKATVLLLSLGMSNKEIGAAVHRSPETVAKYVDALRVVFGVSTRAAIVGQAFCHGVLASAARTAFAFMFCIFLYQPFSAANSVSNVTPVGGGTAMSTINTITYANYRKPGKGAVSTARASIDLASVDPLTNAERFGRYCQKLNAGWVVGKARVAGGVA